MRTTAIATQMAMSAAGQLRTLERLFLFKVVNVWKGMTVLRSKKTISGNNGPTDRTTWSTP